MTDYPTTGTTSIEIEASPDSVWALISDPTRIGEFSPECRRAEWTDGDTPVVGNRFRGYNENHGYEWDVECVVTVSEAPREFAYSVPPGFEHATTWSYTIEPTTAGCRLTESFDAPLLAMPDVYPGRIEGRCAGLQAAIETTVANIKAVAEA